MRPEDLRMMFEQKLNGNMFGAVIREYTFQVWVGAKILQSLYEKLINMGVINGISS